MMNNQEKVKQVDVKSEGTVDARRSFIKGVGIAAPVVFTLTSRSVLGASPCMSQILSGNISQTGNGSCEVGTPLAVWASSVDLRNIPVRSATIDRAKQTRNGETCVKSTSQDINESGSSQEVVVRASLSGKEAKESREDKEREDKENKESRESKESKNSIVDVKIKFKSKPKKEDTYTWVGGMQYGSQKKYENRVEEIRYLKNGEWKEVEEINVIEIPAASVEKSDKFQLKIGNVKKDDNLGDFYEFEGGATYDSYFKDGDKRSFREILTDHADSDKAYLVAAALNAKYYKNYVLSEADVKELGSSSNPKIPPGYTLRTFLAATWGE